MSQNTVTTWQERLSPVKEAWLVYALCPQFLHQVIEGDERQTKVNANPPLAESPGWATTRASMQL